MSVLERISGWVWEASWQAALIAVVVFIAQRLLRTRLSAGWRYALWFLVVARLVMPVLPQSPVSVYNFTAKADWGPVMRAPVAVAEPVPSAAIPSLTVSAPPPERQERQKFEWTQIVPILSAAWAAGAALLGLRLVFGTQLFMRRARRLSRPVSPTLRHLLDEAVELIGTKRPLLMETSAVITPTLAGIWLPRILLPEGIAGRLSEDELRHVLLHELAHVKRRDVAVNWLVNALLAVHWFNPLLWLAFRQMRADREIACDEIALRTMRGDERAAYGETLIKVSDGMPGVGAWMGLVGIFESQDQLEKRIRAIVTGRNVPRYAALLGIVLALAVAAVALTDAADQSKAGKTDVTKSAPSLPEGMMGTADPIVAAAKTGDARAVGEKIFTTLKYVPETLHEKVANQVLVSLSGVENRQAFAVAFAELRNRVLRAEWQPPEVLIENLLRGNQRDSIELLIAENLELKLLSKAAEKVPAEREWVEQRVAEVPVRRAIQGQLTAAARSGDLAGINRLVDAGADVNGADKDGVTGLLAASDAGKTEAVRLLLSRRAKTGTMGRWKRLPITAAASPEIAQILKDADPGSFQDLAAGGENIIAKLRHGSSPAVVKWFLDQGVDPTVPVEGMWPTLLFASTNPEIAGMLIEHGVDVNAADDRGRTALFEVGQYSDGSPSKLVDVLLKHGANPNARDSFGGTPLMAARDAATVELLIAAGADPTAKNNSGESVWKYQGGGPVMDRDTALRRHGIKMASPAEGIAALADATSRGTVDDVKKLLRDGVNPDAPTTGFSQYPEESPMSRALTLGNFEMVAAMREAGGKDVGVLTEAAANGDLATMKELLAKGANVNERNSFGMTPLAFAVRRYQLGAVRLLTENGADPSLFDRYGWTPLTLADDFAKMGMYRSYSGQPGITPEEGAEISKAMIALLEPGFSAKTTDSEGNTAITAAACYTNSSGIWRGRERGGDINHQRPDGMTALMLAITSKPENARLDVARSFDPKTGKETKSSRAAATVRALLSSGANKDLRNRDGKTALDLAKERNDAEIIAILSPEASARDSVKLDQKLLQGIGAGDAEKVRSAIEAGADVNQVNRSGNTPLMNAAAQGSLPIVKLLLEKGADLNQKSIQSGYNATYFSASAQQPEVLEYLISQGGELDTGAVKGSALSVALDFAPEYPGPEATKEVREEFEGRLRKTIDVLMKSGIDPEIRDGVNGFTPLAQAVAFGQKIPMEMLIAAGAKIDAKDGAGATPLTRSMLPYFGAAPRFDVAEYLLEKGADIGAGNEAPSGEREFPSPLKAAMIGGFMHPNAGAIEPLRAGVKMLISRGAKFAMPEGTDAAAMMKAAALGDSATVSSLLGKGTSASVSDNKGWTPLMSASALGYSEIVRSLIQAGADVNAKDASGFTALWLASTNDPNKEDIRLLIEKKADPNPAPPAFGGILLRVVDRKDPELLRELLAAGSDPNIGLKRDVPYFALAGAIHGKQTEMALELIKAGADVNPKSPENRTPLYWAVSKQMPEVVKALIKAAARLDVVTIYDETAISEAERVDNKEIVEILRAAESGGKNDSATPKLGGTTGPNTADELVLLAQKDDAEGISKLLDKGADIDGVSSSNLTALGAAAQAGSEGTVRLLLSRGAKVDKPGTLGYTPLALAKTVAVAQMLKDAGADLNAKTVGEDRILSYVVRFGSPELVRWFLENGADPKIATSDPNFQTLLFNVRNPRIAEILIEHGVDPLAKNQMRENAVFFAAMNNPDATRMIQVFLDHGVDPKITDWQGHTLLMLAPDAAGIDALVAAGADVHARTIRGATAWTLVGNISQPGRDEALIRHGLAKPADEEEGGIFFDAINRRDLGKIQRLLKDGADPDSREGLEGAMSSSRMSLALAWGFPEAVAEMRKAGGKDVGELSEAAATGDLARIRELLAAGASINETTAAGFTPLLFATQRCQLEAMKLLIENGADTGMFDERGETPLSLAEGLHSLIRANSVTDIIYSPVVHVSRKEVEEFCAEALPLLKKYTGPERRNSAGETALCKAAYEASFLTLSSLLSCGSEVNARRTDGMTPLMLAVVGKPPGSLQTVTITNPRSGESKKLTLHGNAVETLLAAGADTALRNNAGKTAKDLAEERKDEELIEIFRRVSVVNAPAKSRWMAVASEKRAPSKGTYREQILTAARAGDGKSIETIITDSYRAPVGIGEEGATEMIDSLLVSRELGAFTVLLDKMLQTNLGKNWQANDELLAGLVKDGRTDFLDVLLARRLDPERLRKVSSAGNDETRSWIARRTGEVEAERKGVDDLIEACAQGNVDEARKLIDAGVDVNGRTSKEDSWTPLTRASAADKPSLVKLLLERGADPNIAKHPGWDYTPLCLAESVEVCQMLKDGGANVHATLFQRDTSILTYVAMFNGAKVVQWFLDEGLDPKMIGDNDQTLLFNAKDVETVELLLSKGVDPNHLDEFGKSALHYARSGDTVRALIKGGAKLTGFKEPLLPGMIQMSQGDAVKAVLESGIKIDQKELQKALIVACHMDRDEAAKALLEAGANANESGEWSPGFMTYPLSVCAVHGSPKTAKVLLEHGADPNGGERPGVFLETAMFNNEKEVMRLLLKAGAKGSSDLATAVVLEDQQQISSLLRTSPNFTEQPKYWDGVMKNAAARGNLAVVRAALEKGVPIALKAEKVGYSGYYSAAWEGQTEVLRHLLDRRPSNAKPEELTGALYAAVSNSHPGEDQRPAKDFEDCVEMLLKAGALKGVEPKKDSLMQAAIFTRFPGGNARVMEMLAAAGANPNPADDEGKKLSEILTENCSKPNCSAPSETVVETFEKLASVKIERGPAK